MSKKRIRVVKVIGWRISDARFDGFSTHYVLPATAEAYEQMVEQIAELIFVPLDSTKGETNRRAAMYLRAIGITPPKK